MCQCCRSPSLWITLLKLVMGLTCFIFFTVNYSPQDVSDNFCGAYTKASGICNVRKNIAMTACTAFTFIIEPAVIITHFRQSQQYEESPLAVIFPTVGFLMYMIGGASMIYSANNYNYPDFGIESKPMEIVVNGYVTFQSNSREISNNGLGYVVSILFLVTGIVYLIHLFVAMLKRCRPPPLPYTMVQANPEFSAVQLIHS